MCHPPGWVVQSMKRFVLTGAPGAGKTAILRQLELDGFSVVEEAATDFIALEQARGIAEPWTRLSFIDSVADLQKSRQLRASREPGIQFHDRSVICTAALALYLGNRVSKTLARELERVKECAIFQNRVFFIRNLGFVTPTEARRITSRKPCALNGSMKRCITTPDSRFSSSRREACPNA